MTENKKQQDNKNEISFSVVYSEFKKKLMDAEIKDKDEADWLIATQLNVQKLKIKFIKNISFKEYKDLQKVLKKRLKGEPISKIFGYTEFYGLKILMNKNVLSPRQETEILAEQTIKTIERAIKTTEQIIKTQAKKTQAKQEIKTTKHQVIKTTGENNFNVLDLCTGSGAIAISIKKNTSANVVASDISRKALKIAKINAENNSVKIEFVKSNLFQNLKGKRFDIIVSNPPYIKSEDIKDLQTEVKNYDPKLALDGGNDGLDFYKKIIDEAPKYLNANGKILFEIGYNQSEIIQKLLTKNFKNINIFKDFNNIDRVVMAQLKF